MPSRLGVSNCFTGMGHDDTRHREIPLCAWSGCIDQGHRKEFRGRCYLDISPKLFAMSRTQRIHLP